ncbi:hypothetical protein BOX15_Mlig032299g1 [Macrostomum lignano]|uniref:Uncharacterized protein n=1 Tax=Macrostomum lignano TaxID=282301 RepID=A0A267DWY5_9PLAT|nr:hypothetical protein BOX15_Mlig032299g2 [Macrostomum lignano]PAA63096.1 hypothetical protein BOX15_Mlig032299g1 [Macrostomum lignano]
MSPKDELTQTRPPQQKRQQPQRLDSKLQDDRRQDRPNLPGTVLLTASAFVAGIVVSLYCLLAIQRRRRLAKKRRWRRQRLGCDPPAPVRGEAPVECTGAGAEPVQLIGFARRGSFSAVNRVAAGDSQLLLAVQRL